MFKKNLKPNPSAVQRGDEITRKPSDWTAGVWRHSKPPFMSLQASEMPGKCLSEALLGPK